MPEQEEQGAAPEKPAAAKPAWPKLERVAFPDAVTFPMVMAIIVGILFVVASVFGGVIVDVPRRFQDLLIATGVALVVSAFGGQGSLRLRSAIFAGVAAIMIGLIWLLSGLDKQPKYLVGQISGIDSRTYSAELTFPKESYKYIDDVTNTLNFVAFEDDLHATSGKLVLMPNDDTEKGFIEISIDCFKPFFASADSIDWEIDTRRMVIYDKRKQRAIIAAKRIEEGDAPVEISKCAALYARNARLGEWLGWLGVGAANAADRPISPAAADLPKIIADLQSDDVFVRRSARSVLARTATQDAPVLFKAIENDDRYRTQLGIMVALTEMLRRDKKMAAQLSDGLTDEQRTVIVDLAGHNDKTMRQYATEFIYDLADPKMAAIAIEKAAASDNAKARYNWLFAARDGWARLDAEQKQETKPLLDDLFVKTQGLAQTQDILKSYR